MKAALLGVWIGITVVLCYPMIGLLFSWLEFDGDLWSHLIATTLPESIWNTVWLILIVVPLAVALGTGLALICYFYRIDGPLIWLLVLPLTIPKYVLGFLYLTILDYSGPLQTYGRYLGLDLSGILQTGTILPVAFVLVLALYPYVFLAMREGLRSLDMDLIGAATLAGANYRQLIFSIYIPQCRPWILAGGFLVAMECLSDFGTVAIFNFDTLTIAIYETWFGLFSFATAAQLASLVGLLALAMLVTLHRNRGGENNYVATRPGSGLPAFLLLQGRCYGLAFCGIVIMLGIGIPVLKLMQLVWFESQFNLASLEPLWNTTLIAAMTAGCVIALVFSLRLFWVMFRRFEFLLSLPMLGYSLPGIIVAIGLLLAIQHIPFMSFLSGTILLSVFGLSIRFYALGENQMAAAVKRIPPNLGEAARLVGASGLSLIKDIYRPYLTRAAVVGGLIVFVDTAKEMPISLMTRSFGFDTMAIKVYEYTAEGRFADAALPALLLCFLGILPLAIYNRLVVAP